MGISIFHRHEYEKIEANEGCYAVYAHTPKELANLRKESEKPEEPLPPFELLYNSQDTDGNWMGEAIFDAETIEELLNFDTALRPDIFPAKKP